MTTPLAEQNKTILLLATIYLIHNLLKRAN